MLWEAIVSALTLLRTRPRTLWPSAMRPDATAPPIKPFAPVTKTRISASRGAVGPTCRNVPPRRRLRGPARRRGKRRPAADRAPYGVRGYTQPEDRQSDRRHAPHTDPAARRHGYRMKTTQASATL